MNAVEHECQQKKHVYFRFSEWGQFGDGSHVHGWKLAEIWGRFGDSAPQKECEKTTY